MLTPLTLVSALALALPTVEWRAPEQCPEAAEIEAKLQRKLAGYGALTTHHSLRAEIEVREAPLGWDLDLHILDGRSSGHQHLRGPSCATLIDDAVALLAIEVVPFVGAFHEQPRPEVQIPRASAPSSEASPASPRGERGGPEPPSPPRPSPRVTPDLPPSAESRPRFLLGTTGFGTLNLFPRITGGPQVHIGVGFERARLELGGESAFGGIVEFSESALGLSLLAVSGSVGGCGIPIVGEFELHACATLGAGAMRGRQIVPSPGPASLIRDWLWSRAELRFAWQLRPSFALLVGLGAQFSLRRPVFDTVLGEQFIVPIFQGHARLGFEFRVAAKEPRP